MLIAAQILQQILVLFQPRIYPGFGLAPGPSPTLGHGLFQGLGLVFSKAWGWSFPKPAFPKPAFPRPLQNFSLKGWENKSTQNKRLKSQKLLQDLDIDIDFDWIGKGINILSRKNNMKIKMVSRKNNKQYWFATADKKINISEHQHIDCNPYAVLRAYQILYFFSVFLPFHLSACLSIYLSSYRAF